MKVHDRIIGELRRQGRTQSEFADFLGVQKSLITHWKTGRSSSYMKYLPQIGKFLNVSTNYLLGAEKLSPCVGTELWEYLKKLRNRPEVKTIFSLTEGATKEDVEQAMRIIEDLRSGK